MSPHLTASLAVLDELLDSLVELVRPLDSEILNWTPPVPDTNSIAALVRHATESTNTWLSRAVNERIPRDRAAEFHARHSAAELVAMIEHTKSESHRRFDLLQGVDLGTVIQVRRHAATEDVGVTRAWCIEHALIHAGEHWGQIQLNRQLYPLLVGK